MVTFVPQCNYSRKEGAIKPPDLMLAKEKTSSYMMLSGPQKPWSAHNKATGQSITHIQKQFITIWTNTVYNVA